MKLAVVLSCEHAGNEIPAAFADLTRISKQTLGSHRGYDPGAHALAQAFAAKLGVRLFAQTVTRLLVDNNRSLDSPTLHSAFSAKLGSQHKKTLLDAHYHPYRNSVQAEVERLLKSHERVVHLSVHSFTPEMRGKVRTTDIGLLFDPKSPFEVEVCAHWRKRLIAAKSKFVVHDNRPYRGDGDGLTTTLRQLLGPKRYAGIELEVNQKYPRRHATRWTQIQDLVTTTFGSALHDLGR